MKNKIKQIIEKNIEIKQKLLSDTFVNKISEVSEICINCIKNNGMIYFCGNGGSANDSEHLTTELLGRFYKDRDPLPAMCLHSNMSYVTAIANDYGYEYVYSRMIKCFGKSGDVLFGLSTSGKSKNVINALKEANKHNIHTIGMTGNNDNFDDICDSVIKVPSNDTPRIQESHILIGHIICELIEERIFNA